MPAPMKNNLIAAAELDRLETWAKYTADMCHSCMSSCCTLPVEVRLNDLIRLELDSGRELILVGALAPAPRSQVSTIRRRA